MSPVPFRFPTLLASMLGANLVFLLANAGSAGAAEESRWDGGTYSAVRLIAGPPRRAAGTTVHRAGIEIRLASGWKTYWRYPGDSGVPPRFDFKASQNVKTVKVRYPAPQRLPDPGGISIGYKQGVVFPLEVAAQDPGKPILLRLSIDYAVCEKICIPAEGKVELTLNGAASTHAPALARAEELVPKPAALGADDALAIRTVQREAGSARLIVEVAAPPDAAVELFAEGPGADWALPVPAPAGGAPAGAHRFTFELDGLPPGAATQGAVLRLTAVAGARAIEVPYRLD
jgi:DsbC/DsbD-like thiol-disulfide interchange protein